MTVLGFAPPRAWRIAAILFVALTAMQPAAAQTLNPRLDRALQHAKPGTFVRVIVQVDPSRRGVVRRLLAAQGYGSHEHPVISALTLDVPASWLDNLTRLPGVLSVSLDAPLAATQTAIVPTTNGSLLRQELGVPATGGYQGAGVGVAVIDSGIAPLATFDSRIRAFYDFTIGGVATTPRDDYGHGTHVAATIGGSGAPYGDAYTGVAPSVSFVGLKVLDANGQGYTSNVIDAIEFAIANKKTL